MIMMGSVNDRNSHLTDSKGYFANRT